MTPIEIVDSYIALASRCLDALIQLFEGVERATVWTGMFLVPRDGRDPVRAGVMPDLGTFQVHGYGCRFELDSGKDIDIDWNPGGRPVFDSWRVLMYARSIGDDAVEREVLRVAASECSALQQLSDDLFAWRHHRYDISRN